jgi:transposase InsO family protein
VLACPEIIIKVDGKELKAIIDTGSEATCISESAFYELVERIPNLLILPVVGVKIVTATTKKSKNITRQVFLPVKLEKLELDVVCLVVKDLISDVILGMDWITDNRVMLDFTRGQISVLGTVLGKESIVATTNAEPPCCQLRCDRGLGPTGDIKCGVNDETLRETVATIPHIDKEQREWMLTLLTKYRRVFSEKPGMVNCYEHTIHVKSEKFFVNRSYPVPFAHRDAVQQQLDRMIEWGIIEKCSTPYINPLIVVVKKDQSVRLCLDARQLNTQLIPENDTPKVPEELLQSPRNVQWMTTLDLVSSYWQIPLSAESKQYTGFKYNSNVYVFKVMPFGLATSLASFVRCMDRVLGDVLNDFAMAYVDDVLISSPSYEDHLDHLEQVFKRLENAGMTINLNKSLFCRNEVPFLGHVLTPSGLSPNPKKLLLIHQWSSPKNQKQLKGFLGLCSYYRRFYAQYASLTAPLRALLTKDSVWHWTDELEQVFRQIKELFVQDVHLVYPDYTKTFYLQCDASSFGLGSQLYQLDENGNQKIVSMASRLLISSEINYNMSEKELLSIVWSLLKYRVFIMGAKLIIITDNKALTFLFSCRLLSGRLSRWILWLQQFSFTIEHCRGKDNVVADTLSRFPMGMDGEIHEHAGNHKEIRITAISRMIETSDELPRELNEFRINAAKVLVQYLSEDLRKEMLAIDILQAQDRKFGSIIKELKSGEKDHESFIISNNRLFLRSEKGNSTWRLCIPDVLADRVINAVHLEMGHFGAQKCLHTINEVFYVRDVARKTRRLVAGCEVCQRTKHKTRGDHGTYSAILPKKPGELIATDLYGPLAVSFGGAKYILVFLDLFTKLVTLYSLKKATTVGVCGKVKQYFDKIQVPEAILADHGTQYTSGLWYRTLEARNVRAYHSSIRHPQSNPSERVMRELGRLFRCYCSSNHASWHKWLPQIEEWINSTCHESTGFAPYELHFNQVYTSKVAKLIKYPRAQGQTPMEHREKIIFASTRMKNKAKLRADRHGKAHEKKTVLSVGEKVWLKSVHVSNLAQKEVRKFFPLFEGPFEVTAVAGNNAYELTDDQGRRKGVFNIINLRRHVEPVIR